MTGPRLHALRLTGGLAGLALLVAALGMAGDWLRERLPGAAVRPASPESFQKGMVFGLFARDDPDHARHALAELKELGVDSISITIPWVIPDVRSLEMAPRSDMTPSDRSLAFAIRAARHHGMRVFLMPFLYVDHMEEHEWRGTIQPPDWDRWFARYEAFILHYAGLAADLGVEYLSVGSELCSTESRREDWLDLIGKVRRVYPGAITYSSNWDHLGGLGFADALDFLGMNAYFKLSESDSPSEEDLVEAWRSIKTRVEAWRRAGGKPMVITEVGYPNRRGAGTDPWNYDGAGPPDPEGQRRCYRAFRRAWGGEPSLSGVYFYLWWGQGGPEDTGYTPRGKPASEVIRDWYAGSPVEGGESS